MDKPETITIPLSMYENLMASHTWLMCLESAGVDSWDGFAFAQELMEGGNTHGHS